MLIKARRAFHLKRIFYIILPCFCCLLVLFLLWNPTVAEFKSQFYRENERIRAPLIVDMDCLKRLASGNKCAFPIKVALLVDQQLEFYEDRHFTHIAYHLTDDPAKSFWFFHNNIVDESVATKRFKTRLTTLQFAHPNGTRQIQLAVPDDGDAFARAWRNGHFIECHPLLVRPKSVARRIPVSFLDNVVKFVDLIAQFNATAFIFSGTLLGWRRECSLIPHTYDIDLAIFAKEHSNALLRAILTSPTFTIYWTLGRLRDSFELTVEVDGIKIDLFYLYNHNNWTFTNGMRPAQRQRMRFAYPRLSGRICAGELHGRLVHLPCDYQKVIEADYGAVEWTRDWHTDTFVWDKSHKNREDMEFYSDEEWENVFVHVQNKADRFNPAKVDEWMARINKTM